MKKAEFAKVMRRLEGAYRIDLDKNELDAFWQAVKVHNVKDFTVKVADYIDDESHQFFPRPGQIIPRGDGSGKAIVIRCAQRVNGARCEEQFNLHPDLGQSIYLLNPNGDLVSAYRMKTERGAWVTVESPGLKHLTIHPDMYGPSTIPVNEWTDEKLIHVLKAVTSGYEGEALSDGFRGRLIRGYEGEIDARKARGEWEGRPVRKFLSKSEERKRVKALQDQQTQILQEAADGPVSRPESTDIGEDIEIEGRPHSGGDLGKEIDGQSADIDLDEIPF